MKKNILLLLTIVCAFTTHAQHDEPQYRYRMQAAYVYGVPLGAFSSGSLPTGQNESLSGISCLVGIRAHRQFSISLQFSDEKFSTGTARSNTLQRQAFSTAGFYTTVTNRMPYIDVSSVALQCGYSMKFLGLEIEPYFSLGIGYTHLASDHVADIRRKQKNDNYTEDITRYIDHSDAYFFYPGVGVQLSRKIGGCFYGYLGVQYNHGEQHYTQRDEHTDYLNNTTSTSRDVSQEIAALQVQAGIQYRLHKYHK